MEASAKLLVLISRRDTFRVPGSLENSTLEAQTAIDSVGPNLHSRLLLLLDNDKYSDFLRFVFISGS